MKIQSMLCWTVALPLILSAGNGLLADTQSNANFNAEIGPQGNAPIITNSAPHRLQQVTGLESQTQKLDQRAHDLNSTITALVAQLEQTRALKDSGTDKAFWEKELKRLTDEKAALEKELKDLNMTVAQTQHLQGDIRTPQRLEFLGNDKVDDYVASGKAKETIKDWDGAIADFTKAIDLNATNAEAYFGRAYAKYSKKDFVGTIADDTKAIHLNANYASAYMYRALAEQHSENEEAALADFRKAKSVSNDPRTQLDAASLLAKLATDLLEGAVSSGNRARVEEFITDGANLNTKDSYNGQTVLFHAPKRELVEMLITRGLNVDATDNDGRTPLFYAANSGVAEELVAHGAKVDVRDTIGGATPLFAIDNIGAAEVLIKHGADVNARTKGGSTALHWAYSTGTNKLDFLISHGADINVKDNEGMTPLAFYLSFPVAYKAYVEALTSRGADVNAMDNEAYSVLDHAVAHKIRSDDGDGIVQFLISHGARRSPPPR